MEPDQPIAFTPESLTQISDSLATKDTDLAQIIRLYGYTPFWDRPNTFETLVHIILEQQVSLASARAALEKLRARVGTITPKPILEISEHEFTGLYISRQKKTYIQALANEIKNGQLNLAQLAEQSDEEIRTRLLQLKGFGNWTVDIYLIMVLHRPDHFPFGDVAAVNALKQLKGLPKETIREELETITEQWRPYRSVAAMLLWHYYLSVRGRNYS